MEPSDFMDYPFDSVFKKSECETVAQNIMKILSRTGDEFRKLSFNEYKKERIADGNFSDGEKQFFDMVIPYCKSPDTARLFSKIWNKV